VAADGREAVSFRTPDRAGRVGVLERYGHLLPGSESEAAVLLDAYLTESREQAQGVGLADANCGEVGSLTERSGAVLDGHYADLSAILATGETAAFRPTRAAREVAL
jgi:hypothetical protein